MHQGRERAEVSKFARTLDEIVLSLREVDQVYLLRGTRATWVLDRVEHQRDDLVVRLGPRNVPPGRDVSDMMVPVQALVNGAEVLQDRATVPELFAPKTVTRLAKLATPDGGVQGVSLSTYNGKTRDRVELDNAVRDNAIAAVNPIQIAYGSVTGTLSGLRHVQRRGGGVQVTLRDDLERRAITGLVPESQAEQLRQLWRHRVLLGGIIKRNGSGQAIRIDVDRIERMPDDDTGMPSTDALLGAASGWLGDMAVDDFITEMRDG